jgi:hypothetical protein
MELYVKLSLILRHLRPSCIAACLAQANLLCFPSDCRVQAVYQQLDAVRVKGRQLPLDIYEVTSLHADAISAGQRPILSPLGPQSLAQAPSIVAMQAAAVAAAAGLGRGGSGAALPAGASLERLDSATAGAPQQAQQAQQQQRQQQQPLELCCDDWQPPPPQRHGDALMDLNDRLLSIASTAAAPIRLMPHTPMIGESGLAGNPKRGSQSDEQAGSSPHQLPWFAPNPTLLLLTVAGMPARPLPVLQPGMLSWQPSLSDALSWCGASAAGW